MDIKGFKAWAESKKLSTDGETGRNYSYTFYDSKTQAAWDAWQAKAQAVPECTWSRNEDYYFDTSCGNNFMFTECEDKPSEHQFKHCCYCGGKLIEAQEQKITLLKVEWASDCFECGHHEAIIYSTASEASAKGWFHDGDAVKCCKCGHTGEMDARGEDSDICWNEEPTNV